jgi:hypothetical protein
MIDQGTYTLTDFLRRGVTAEPTRREIQPARTVFRRLLWCGLSPEEAGNLTARLEGLERAGSGWRLAEVERLLFLRWLVESGRLVR